MHSKADLKEKIDLSPVVSKIVWLIRRKQIFFFGHAFDQAEQHGIIDSSTEGQKNYNHGLHIS